jgi:DNA-binding NarL/FixJ family response regulator
LFDALERSAEAEDFLVLLAAFRARPQMIQPIYAELPDLVAEVLTRGEDRQLATEFGVVLTSARTDTEVGSLSRRELEVLGLLGQGLTNAEIARTLFISEATAKLHVRRILAKTGSRSRTQAAILARG